MDVLTSINLFSGYGGFDLALRLAGIESRTVCYVEWDKYCQQVIRQRQIDGFLDDAPIFGGDIRKFDGLPWRGRVDIISASPPCQPYSQAGKRRADDDRNLFPDTLRIVSEIQPRRVYVENVPGLNVRPKDGRPAYGSVVVGELAALGYDCRWDTISAKDAGAPHLRKRWWLVAHARS